MNDSMFIDIVNVIAKQSNCQSHQVGCLITSDDGRIISTGYNGSVSGAVNCSDKKFKSAAEHHKWSQNCEIHAEINCIAFAAKNGVAVAGGTMYCTLQPCNDCLKAIVQCGIKKIVYVNKYDRSDYNQDVILMLAAAKVTIEQHSIGISGTNINSCYISDINNK